MLCRHIYVTDMKIPILPGFSHSPVAKANNVFAF